MDGLKDEYRRMIIRHLDEAQTPMTVSSVATAVAQQAAAPGQPQQVTELHSHVQPELRHTHLPKLNDLEVIEYDRNEQRVEEGPLFDEALSMLRDLA